MEDELRKVFYSIESAREMGAYKVLITFPSKAKMEDIFEGWGNLLCEYFANVRE